GEVFEGHHSEPEQAAGDVDAGIVVAVVVTFVLVLVFVPFLEPRARINGKASVADVGGLADVYSANRSLNIDLLALTLAVFPYVDVATGQNSQRDKNKSQD